MSEERCRCARSRARETRAARQHLQARARRGVGSSDPPGEELGQNGGSVPQGAPFNPSGADPEPRDELLEAAGRAGELLRRRRELLRGGARLLCGGGNLLAGGGGLLGE